MSAIWDWRKEAYFTILCQVKYFSEKDDDQFFVLDKSSGSVGTEEIDFGQ